MVSEMYQQQRRGLGIESFEEPIFLRRLSHATGVQRRGLERQKAEVFYCNFAKNLYNKSMEA